MIYEDHRAIGRPRLVLLAEPLPCVACGRLTYLGDRVLRVPDCGRDNRELRQAAAERLVEPLRAQLEAAKADMRRTLPGRIAVPIVEALAVASARWQIWKRRRRRRAW